MPEPKRIERRVMNGGGPVVLRVELGTPHGPENGIWMSYFIDGSKVAREEFEVVLQMLALPQGPSL